VTFGYPPELHRIVYTANAIENMHMQLRKIVKTPRPFPQRRGRQQITLSDLAQHREGLEDAAYHLAASRQSVRHSVR
jgi:putative transposase